MSIELQKAKCALNFNELGNYENVFKNNTLSLLNFKAANKRKVLLAPVSSVWYTFFPFYKNVVFLAQAEYCFFFLPILGWKYSCIIPK